MTPPRPPRLGLFQDGESLPRPGLFAGITVLAPVLGSDRAARLAAVSAAEAAGCGWMLAAGSGETLCADALEIASPATLAYDAVFGAIAVGDEPGPWKPSRLAFDEPSRLPHALLHWWIGDRPLIRTAAERRALEALPGGAASRTDYLFEVWNGAHAIKLAAPFTRRADTPPGLRPDEREAILRRLSVDPVFLDISYGDAAYRLPYTGRNAGIEREQTRGLFFEAAELEVLKRRIGPGAVIADLGANTGNHTVFFAGPMRAARVVPFEPLAELADIIRWTVARNGLANVDTSHLEIGLADRPARMAVRRSERGGFGATRLVPDENGTVPVARLDDVLTGRLDLLKIDVESMELQVLAGAEATILRERPVIFIEIAHDNTVAFMTWLGERSYRIERIFPDKGHANYLIAPDDGRQNGAP